MRVGFIFDAFINLKKSVFICIYLWMKIVFKLFAAEVSVAAFEKRLHAFLCVFGCEQRENLRR